ncbi:MAG: biotin/lipoyl-binding protein, partial [Gammaproteobacteria bacterium]
MTKDELEFLPAALEIQETPPLPVSRWILWSILLLFAIAVIWSILGEVDIVGVAQGKIVPSGKVKIIQPLEPGVVRTIHVQEGDLVTAGQPLIELDSTLAGADQESIREQQLALKLDRARLLTLLEKSKGSGIGDQGPVTDHRHPARDTRSPTSGSRPLTSDLFQELAEATPAQIRQQQERARSELHEYLAHFAALQEEKSQRLAEQNAIRQRIEQLDATIPLISERSRALEELVKKSMVPRVQWLELEQERIEQVKERDVQRNNLLSLEASMANIQQRLSAQRAEFETKLLTELTETENRLAALEQERVKTEKRVTLQTLTAPVAGKVHQLAVH